MYYHLSPGSWVRFVLALDDVAAAAANDHHVAET